MSSHDLLASPFPGQESVLPDAGLISVEIKCKEIRDRNPKTFVWEETVTGEALVLFKKENDFKKDAVAGRVLVLCEMHQPCHDGPFRLHGSLYTTHKGWHSLWGWSGFKRQASADQVVSAPKRKAAATNPHGTQQAQWDKLQAGLPVFKDVWVALPKFLKDVEKPRNQAKRYLEAGNKDCWTSAVGGAPRKGVDWKQMKGDTGGGQGNGWYYCRISFLKHVYMFERLYKV